MRCGVRSKAIAAVARWARSNAPKPQPIGHYSSGHTVCSPFFWEAQYTSTATRPIKDWFLHSRDAAVAAADAFCEHLRGRQPPEHVHVLNLGCGISRLGQEVEVALAMQLGSKASVMNVDYSPASIAAAAREAIGDRAQHHVVWDATDGSSPPSLPGSSDSQYELIVDKGTLDVFIYSSAERLVLYCASLRSCLLRNEGNGAVGLAPLYVHFSDDESHGELLEAAFPPDEWSVSGGEIDLESERDLAWTGGTYRFTVSARGRQ
jgi:hypothetical protein